MQSSLFLCAALVALAVEGQPAAQISVTVEGFRNPFLAGQPNGRTSKQDSAPAQSPVLVNLTIGPGQGIVFPSTSGTTSNCSCPLAGPEGHVNQIQSTAADLGISGYRMPLSGLLGVFLSATTNSGNAPPDLDFSTPASRDFTELRPLLYQTFYIGDGMGNGGQTIQRFVAPPGASRLYLGTVDGSEWNNNIGAFQATVAFAGLTFFGASSPGCQGLLAIGASSAPKVGNYGFSVTCTNAPPSSNDGFLLLSGAPLSPPVPILGVTVWVDLSPPTLAFRTPSNASGSSFVPLLIPNVGTLVGAGLFAQFLWIGPTAPPFCPPRGVSTSNALQITIQPG